MVWHADYKIWTSGLPKHKGKDTVQVESASESIQELQLKPASIKEYEDAFKTGSAISLQEVFI